MNNLRILLYMMLLSLAACHPEGTSVKQGLDVNAVDILLLLQQLL